MFTLKVNMAGLWLRPYTQHFDRKIIWKGIVKKILASMF